MQIFNYRETGSINNTILVGENHVALLFYDNFVFIDFYAEMLFSSSLNLIISSVERANQHDKLGFPLPLCV
jgi:hypothetical protein